MTKSDRIKTGQTVDLVTEIKRLIRSYPGGLGLIKELIQNADDANARKIEITLDLREHNIRDLPEPEMEKFLGPSLLVFNDAVFNEKDFEAIQSIGRGSKRNALTKAGRFGLGFNSVYHITDYPSVASFDRVLFFDPRCSVFSQGGEGWRLEDSEISSYLELYASGIAEGHTLRNSTVFRLPLRINLQDSKHIISKTIFDDLEIENFKKELFKISEELLLFLKSIDEIRIYEIPPKSNGQKKELLKVTTTNKQEVFEHHQKLLLALQGDPENLWDKWQINNEHLPSVSYLHRIEITCQGKQHQSLWRVCNLIRLDQTGEMYEGIQAMAECEEKAVPWAGAAARIPALLENDELFKGQAYCFLPLNFTTGLPVHLHGFFDIDEARTDLTREIESADEKRKIRAQWNLLLVEHVLSYAYAHLLTKLVDDIGNSDPHRFYSYFPVSTSNETLRQLPNFVARLLWHKQVIRSAVRHCNIEFKGDKKVIHLTHWIAPSDVEVLPYKSRNLLAPLREDKVDLPDPPIPTNIQDVFAESDLPLSIFQPSDLRERLYCHHVINQPLMKVKRPCLRKREWILNL